MTILSESPLSENRNATKQDRKRDRSKELRQRIDERLEHLAQAVDDVRASETFKQYLDVQARFHRYSWHNTFLISMQRPDASQVAGFRAWTKLGRHVRKGEHGIKIIAPCPFKRERERETDAGDKETVDGMFFRVVHVFDVAQTDGETLPSVDIPTVGVAADMLLDNLQLVAVNRKINVEFKPIESGAFGVSRHGTVEIANGHTTGQQAKTLAHELAHEALHWDVKGPITRNIAELEAESVAYVVCTHFALDVEVRASRYIAIWGGDAKALRKSLQRIATTARAIIDDVEALDGRKGGAL